jgi:hypothetical protein
MDDFKLTHDNGRLFVEVVVDGKVYTKDITDIFEKPNAIDDFLDYHIGLKK